MMLISTSKYLPIAIAIARRYYASSGTKDTELRIDQCQLDCLLFLSDLKPPTNG